MALSDYRNAQKFSQYDTDFWEYNPHNYPDEVRANIAWTGKELDPIEPEKKVPVPPLDPYLKALIDNPWKGYQPSYNAAPQPLMGNQRTQPPVPPAQNRPLPTDPHITLQQMKAQGIPIPPRPGQPLPPPPVRPGMPAPVAPSIERSVPVSPVQLITRKTAVAMEENKQKVPEFTKTAFAADWNLQSKIDRVNAIAFRGESRIPSTLKADGFKPPVSRTDDYYRDTIAYPQFRRYLNQQGQDVTPDEFKDFSKRAAFSTNPGAELQFYHYSVWRLILERESAHLGRALTNEALKGFICASRATSVAKAFATDKANPSNGGWVYVLKMPGAYKVPMKGASEWTELFGEQEIAHLGALDWKAALGFRHVGSTGKFDGQVYLRSSFVKEEPNVAEKVFHLLSGQKQG